MRKPITIIALSLALLATSLLQAVPAVGQVGQAALENCRELAFSTEEDFLSHGPVPPDGNPIISDGDLLGIVEGASGVSCAVCARNWDLLNVFEVQASVDLGLDAADVVEVREYLVAFSTELDSPNVGQFTAGDLLVTNGVIISNGHLTYLFGVGYDIGLDGVHFVGEVEAIVAFLKELGSQGVPPASEFAAMLDRSNVDIWFSTEGTFTPGEGPGFLDGDLLSAASGIIVAGNSLLLPLSVPAGIPDRGVDFGLDAVTTDREGQRERIHFSTEILFDGEPDFTDGDALRLGNGVAARNWDFIGCFEPNAKELGLDALSVNLPVAPPCESKIDYVAGVHVSDIGGDGLALAGTVGAIMAPVPFGGEIDIGGNICADVQEFRVVYRQSGSANPWTGMDVLSSLGWTLKNDALIPPWSDCDGTQTWASDADGWYDGANYRGLSACNSDMALTVWDSAHVGMGLGGPDAFYEIALEVRTATELLTDTMHLVQLDNTPPVGELERVAGTCDAFTSSDMPLTVTGRISDTYFYRYSLSITGDGYGWHHYAPVAYYDDLGDNAIDLGTVNWDNYVGLHQVSVFELDASPVACGYTVMLRAWERTLWCDFKYASNQEYHYPGHRQAIDAWTFNYTP